MNTEEWIRLILRVLFIWFGVFCIALVLQYGFGVEAKAWYWWALLGAAVGWTSASYTIKVKP